MRTGLCFLNFLDTQNDTIPVSVQACAELLRESLGKCGIFPNLNLKAIHCYAWVTRSVHSVCVLTMCVEDPCILSPVSARATSSKMSHFLSLPRRGFASLDAVVLRGSQLKSVDFQNEFEAWRCCGDNQVRAGFLRGQCQLDVMAWRQLCNRLLVYLYSFGLAGLISVGELYVSNRTWLIIRMSE